MPIIADCIAYDLSISIAATVASLSLTVAVSITLFLERGLQPVKTGVSTLAVGITPTTEVTQGEQIKL